MRHTIKAATLGLLLGALATSSAWAYDSGDSQLWLTIGASGKVDEKTKLSIGEHWRIGDDMSELYYYQTEIKGSYSATKWLTLSAGYAEANARKNKQVYDADGNETIDHYWNNEHRPLVAAQFKGSYSGWQISDRIQIEWRMRDGMQDYTRSRNLIMVKTPWKWTDLKVNPYAYYEAFLSDLPSDVSWTWVRQRLSAGVSMSFTEQLKGNIYYLCQWDWVNSDWQHYNIAGLSASAAF